MDEIFINITNTIRETLDNTTGWEMLKHISIILICTVIIKYLYNILYIKRITHKIKAPAVYVYNFNNESKKETGLPTTTQTNQLDRYKDITQIDTMCGNKTVSFKKINVNDLKKNIGSSILSGGTQIGALALANSHLFMATVDPSTLMKYTTGAISSIVRGEGGKIINHAGFVSANLNFTPVVIMQLMSIVTGQYYLNGITKQLNNIDKKISMLIQFHHTEKTSKLENAYTLLQNLSGTKYPNIEHLTQLKMIENQVGDIYEEYLSYLQAESYSNIELQAKDLEIRSKKDLENIASKYDESPFPFCLRTTITADEILHLIPIIEFSLNVKINSTTKDRSNRINELFEKINKLKREDFFAYSSARGILEEYYSPLLHRLQMIKNDTWFHEDRADEIIGVLHYNRGLLQNEILDMGNTYEIKNNLIEQLNTPMNLLYSINENGCQLMCIKENEEYD